MKKKKKIILLIIVLFLLAFLASLFFFSKKEKIEYLTFSLEKQDLSQTVSEIGTVRASQEIELNFLQLGRLDKVLVEVGDQVEKDDVLAELDYESLIIRKEEILAGLSIAKTNQEKLIKGASAQDIAILEAQVKQGQEAERSAQLDLDNTKKLVSENIYQAEKNLNDLKAPNSLVPMSIKQAIESAKINLNNINKSSQQNLAINQEALLSSLAANFSNAQSILDAIKRIKDDEDIKNVFSVRDYSYKIILQNYYEQSMELINPIERALQDLKKNPQKEGLENLSQEILGLLDLVSLSLDYCFRALEKTIVSSSFPQSSLDSFKNIINNNKNQVNLAINSLQGAKSAYLNSILSRESSVLNAQDNLKRAEVALSDALNQAADTLSLTRLNGEQQISGVEARFISAQKNHEVLRAQLNKIKTPASSTDLSLTQSQIDQAQANLELIEKQIDENILKAPIRGRIAKISYEVGEPVSSIKPMISLLAEDDFEIEVLISESDISKIKIDNEVKISFDAFGDDYQVLGRVYFIEPSATSISDVIYYKIKITFPSNLNEEGGEDFIIKSGMTANIDIITNHKEDVFIVPSRSILSRGNSESYVRVLEGKKVREVVVQLGISGDQAMIEIFSEDLKEGDLIVSSIRNN